MRSSDDRFDRSRSPSDRPIVEAVIASADPSTPPAYVNAGSAVSGTGALTPGMPATIVAGNILLLWVANTYTTTSAATLSDAQGFAQVTGAAVDSGAYSGIHAYGTLFWKRAAGGDAAPTVADNGEASVARVYQFSGCAASGDPWDVVSTTADNSGDSSMSATGVTTTVANTLVCCFIAAFDNSASATLESAANTGLTSVTEQDDAVINVTGGFPVGRVLITGERAATGATGATTGTWSTGVYWVWSAVTVALKPA